MKKICIALDTSPSAVKIARIGYEYALALNAEIVLVHVVYDSSLYVADYDPIMQYDGFLIRSKMELTGDIKEEAKRFLTSTAKFLGEPDLEIKVLDGNIHEQILKFAKIWDSDLIVLGTHSHNALESVMLGNIATKIIKHSKIPLLVIPVKN